MNAPIIIIPIPEGDGQPPTTVEWWAIGSLGVLALAFLVFTIVTLTRWWLQDRREDRERGR